MNSKPLVSVIVLAYNHEKFIEKALDSILSQDVDFDFEVVIGEDLSSDKTRSIIIEYKNRYPEIIIPLIRNQNLGAPSNFYDALMNCRGDYIAFLEGDDYWINKDKLKKQLIFLQSNPQYIGVAHRNVIVNKSEEIIGESHKKVPINRSVGKKDLLKFTTDLAHPSSMFYRNIFKNGDYEIIKNSNKYGIHFMMLSLLVKEGELYILPDMMSAWRCVVEETASNYTSMAMKKPLIAIDNYFVMLKNFEVYFGNFYDYSFIRSSLFASSIYQIIVSDIENKRYFLEKFWSYLCNKEKMISLILFFKKGFQILYNKIVRIWH